MITSATCDTEGAWNPVAEADHRMKESDLSHFHGWNKRGRK
jgi:hypothetical protein